MNRVLYAIAFVLLLSPVQAQVPDSLLKSIIANNHAIKAGSAWLESELARSKTGIYPGNPEITWNYLWGNPDAIGNQRELEITQSFMFPGYYFARSEMQKIDFAQKEILFEKSRKEVLFEAENEIIMLIWLGKKEALLISKLDESSRLLEMMQMGFERKEISKPAFDKIRLYHLSNQTELEKLRSEIISHRETLKLMNGGLPVDFEFSSYAPVYVLPDLDEFKKKAQEFNPDIRIAHLNKELSGSKVKVERMNRLPSIEAGYKGETILNQKLQGIHTGITIPLWENKNKVKQTRLEETWSGLNYDKVVEEIKTAINVNYSKAQSVLTTYNRARQIIMEPALTNSTFELLKAGEISFPEYLTEIQLILDNQLYFLETERDYFLLLNNLELITGN